MPSSPAGLSRRECKCRPARMVQTFLRSSRRAGSTPREREPVAWKSQDRCTEGFSMARHLIEVRGKCKASRGGALGVKEPPGFLQPGAAGALGEARCGADVVDQFFQPL